MIETVSEGVISAVAQKEGVAEHSLTPPLYEVIDPDALDALYDHQTRKQEPFPTVKFRYNGYNVIVNAPEEIEVQKSTTT
jgi:hypothetical protein